MRERDRVREREKEGKGSENKLRRPNQLKKGVPFDSFLNSGSEFF